MLTRDIFLITTIIQRIGAEVDGYYSKPSGCNQQLKQNLHGDGMCNVNVVARSMKWQLVVSGLAEWAMVFLTKKLLTFKLILMKMNFSLHEFSTDGQRKTFFMYYNFYMHKTILMEKYINMLW